jgi:hypothetical protein
MSHITRNSVNYSKPMRQKSALDDLEQKADIEMK